ncbi:MAG: Hepatitis C virus core protein [Cyanobium sp.]
MILSSRSPDPPLDASHLEPPRGYRALAWLGLVANILALPLGLILILIDPTWRTAHIAIGAGALLPCAAVGIVACIALLRWRHWGQVLAIVALAMSLAIALPYSIVRLVLLPEQRLLLAVLSPVLWLSNAAVLVFWCRPAVRRYLR